MESVNQYMVYGELSHDQLFEKADMTVASTQLAELCFFTDYTLLFQNPDLLYSKKKTPYYMKHSKKEE